MIGVDDRPAVVAEARELVAARWPGLDPDAACLYVAWSIVSVARVRFDHRLTIMAGSAHWPRLTPETDDGRSPHRFGYDWTLSARSRQRVADGEMPEMHVWAFDPATREIVDATAGAFPRQCAKLIGFDWQAPLPPECFWDRADALPSGPSTGRTASRPSWRPG